MSALPFPTRVTSPRRYREVVHRGVDDAQYHFRIGLPPDFTSVLRSAPRPSPRLPASGIGFFLGPDEATHASVYATTIDREVAMARWLPVHLGMLGLEIVEARPLEGGRGGATLDVLTRGEQDGVPVVGRWRAVKDSAPEGGRILWVRAQTTADEYAERAEDLLAVVDAFDVAHRTKWPFAERLRSVLRLGPARTLFFHPASWTVIDQPVADAWAGPRRLDLFHFQRGAPVGRVTVIATRAPWRSPDPLFTMYLDSLRAKDIELDLPAAAPIPALGNLLDAWERAGPARLASSAPDEAPLHVQVRVGREGDLWYLVSISGFSREAEPMMYAINERCYEIVCRYLRVGEGMPS